MKVTYAKRVPPGDRWQIGNDIYESLTECLNQIFLNEGVVKFEIDASVGEVFISPPLGYNNWQPFSQNPAFLVGQFTCTT